MGVRVGSLRLRGLLCTTRISLQTTLNYAYYAYLFYVHNTELRVYNRHFLYYYNICIFSRDDPFYLLAYWLRHRNTFRAT
jgi:hypothetical protein